MIHVRENERPRAAAVTPIVIEDSLQPSEAHDVLRGLIGSLKCNSEVRNLRSQVRCQETDSNALTRIQDLEQCRADSEELLRKARETGASLRIRTVIELATDDDSKTFDR